MPVTKTLSAETWHFGYSETFDMSDLIPNNQKPVKLGEIWKLILDW